MSSRLTPIELSNKVFDYLSTYYPPETLNKAHWCMNIPFNGRPRVAYRPDTDNMFPSCICAMEYVLEEGLPVWVVADKTYYPLDVFSFGKLELLFNV